MDSVAHSAVEVRPLAETLSAPMARSTNPL